ncbi:hypothetical protein KPH14_011424 [Odynerus spinipes]|uniref:Odorant receptor n=1 Tax=Odynerus spinipes TaxID=1348599 RepID=A0AAD9VUF7_9HYME|nr:hypothetical protein KPH14_011424 [Odynerus spinipes]
MRSPVRINFCNTNRLNVLVNLLSGNILPITSDGSELSLISKLYAICTWIIELIYISACVIGIFRVSKETALRECTVNIVIAVEVLLNLSHMYHQRNLLKQLVDSYNGLLAGDDDLLRTTVVSYVGPVEKLLKLYTIADVGSVITWVATPLMIIFQKTEFVHEDYALPISFSKEPFSRGVFIASVILEIFGSGYAILKKIGTDIYTLHLILLLTAQYKYMRTKLGLILRNETSRVKIEFNSLLRHHSEVVRATIMLKKVLSFNVCVVHLDSVFRFCFLSFMLATNTSINMEGCLVLAYSVGAIIQLYMICFYIQELFEAGTMLTDDAFHAPWYSYELSIRQNFRIMIYANRLKCRLASFQSVDLTLPSFMQIINQAYSTCLLFLKVK